MNDHTDLDGGTGAQPSAPPTFAEQRQAQEQSCEPQSSGGAKS